MKKLGSELVLGILVVTLSVFATVANYFGTVYAEKNAGHEAAARQHLADANREDGLSMQLIVLDYTMYDGFYINAGVNNDAADYYYENFSDELYASVERDDPFDEQYYDEIYATSYEYNALADDEFAEAAIYAEKQSAMGMITLLSAIGLSFAAYASLLKEGNRLRSIFGLLATIALIATVIQFLSGLTL